MAIYFIIFTIFAIFSAFEVYGLKQTESKMFFALFSFFLFILSFIRWETGTDWITYYSSFNQFSEWGIENGYEWGFARINEFVKIFFDNYTVLLFILGAILFAFQSSAILKYSPYPVTSLLLLWSTTFANVFFVRQSIATVILFFSVRYIQEKKLFKFLLLVGLAMLIHRTSLIFILAWWVYGLKLRPIIMMFYIALSLVLALVLSKLMMSLGGIAGGVAQQKIEYYLENGEETFGGSSSIGQILVRGFANKIFIFVLSLLFLLRIEKKGLLFRGYVNLYWMGIILYFATISISIALTRLSYAYDMMLIVLVPIVLNNIERKYLRFFVFFVFIFYSITRLYISITGNYYDEFVPLKTIFG